jgi:hypothetical protein
MTVSATIARTTFTAVGAGTTLALAFPIQRIEDLKIVKTPSGGSPALLVYGTDYSIEPRYVGAATGLVTLVAPTAAGDVYVMSREVEYAQDLDLRNQGAYSPENLQSTLDRIVEMIQTATSNPIVFGLTVELGDLPLPVAVYDGAIYRVRTPGLPDILVVCLRKADGTTYEWTTLASASA